MAALSWMCVAVAFFAIVRNGLSALDQNQLAPVVQEILNRYTPNYSEDKIIPPMFSVAVSVPYNSKNHMFDMSKVPDSGEDVRNTILNCDVYKGKKVVAATVLRWPNVLKQCPNKRVQWIDLPTQCRGHKVMTWADVERLCGRDKIQEGRADHAEYRTLQHINTLTPKNQQWENDLMIFYIRASSCDSICTNPDNSRNILNSIKQVQKWKNYAIVFSDVFKRCEGKDIPEDKRRESLNRLASSVGGLKNIFRCYPEQEVRCVSCYNNGGVTHACFSDGLKPGSKSSGGGSRKGRVQQ